MLIPPAVPRRIPDEKDALRVFFASEKAVIQREESRGAVRVDKAAFNKALGNAGHDRGKAVKGDRLPRLDDLFGLKVVVPYGEGSVFHDDAEAFFALGKLRVLLQQLAVASPFNDDDYGGKGNGDKRDHDDQKNALRADVRDGPSGGRFRGDVEDSPAVDVQRLIDGVAPAAAKFIGEAARAAVFQVVLDRPDLLRAGKVCLVQSSEDAAALPDKGPVPAADDDLSGAVAYERISRLTVGL